MSTPAVHLEQYLRRWIPEIGDAAVEMVPFTTGRSNPTYLLRAGQWRAVLRRPPSGPVAPGAHDMEREYNILHRLHAVYPLAPRPYLFCPDPAILGVPFYVMEFRCGVVVNEAWPSHWSRTAVTCRQIADQMVQALVDLHAVDYAAAGLAGFGRPDGFMARQVEAWIRRYERAKTDPIPDVERVARWLLDHLPRSPAPTIVHNDFKLNNLMLADDPPHPVVAVLDWELCTIGDPLADLGALLAYWAEPGDERVEGGESVTVHTLPEFTSRRELAELYARKSGRDLQELNFYITYAFFKTGVIMQQLDQRWRAGLVQDDRFRLMSGVTRHLFRQAALAIQGSQR